MQVCPPGYEASAQALLAVAHASLGPAVGNMLGGWAMQPYGAKAMYT